jgi:hypothetical protein
MDSLMKSTKMKINAILAGVIAASLSFQAQAGYTGFLSKDLHRPMTLQTAGDSDVMLASCQCEAGNATAGCDLAEPMQFGGCDSTPCCDSISSCDSLGCDTKSLFGHGWIKPSEGCYDDFISPMTNPVYFEDPRQLTEARAIFINHKLPSLAGLPADAIRLYALQVRLRLTERLSLIAVKDGYIDSSHPLIENGWADIGAGLKYSLYRNPNAGRLLSAGARFETTAGRRRSLQGNGDGVFDFFLSGGARLGSRAHYMTTSGFILPVDTQAENQMFYWSNHLDRRIGNKLYAFSELNWYNYMKNASAFPLPVEGGDLFNLGSPGVRGNNLVTNAWGLKVKPNRNIESGIAFEFPLTERRGVLDNRLTADLIVRF